MTKISGWILAVYVIAITGIAGYEYAYIDKLQLIIRILLSGTQN